MYNKFSVTFLITLTFYIVLDFYFDSMMLYVLSNLLIGSVNETFKMLGLNLDVYITGGIWFCILLIVTFLFYKSNNKFLKYILLVLIAGLLYVIDFFIAIIPYSQSTSSEYVFLIGRIIIILMAILKSLLISSLIYYVILVDKRI